MKRLLLTAFFGLAIALTARAATYNIVSYGALAGPTADPATNQGAIQRAIDAAVLNNGTVYVPSGVYYVTSTTSPALNVTGNCTIQGDGENGSILALQSGTDFIKSEPTADTQHLSIYDLTLTTMASDSQSAIVAKYASTSNPSTGLVANRVNIKTWGVPYGGGAWVSGIKLLYAKHSSIKYCFLSSTFVPAPLEKGGLLPGSGKGISIEGDSGGTVIVSTNLDYWNTAIDISAPLSSTVIIKRVLMVAVYKGIYASQDVGPLVVQNSHVDARGNGLDSVCVDLPFGSSGAIIKNNLFEIAYNTQSKSNIKYGRIHIRAKGSNLSLDGNHFYGNDSAGGVAITNGSDHVTIKDSMFIGIPPAVNAALYVQASVTSSTIDGDVFTGCGSNPITIESGAGVTQSNTRHIN